MEMKPFSEDYFERLGLTRECSTSEIQRAKKQSVKRFHPDLHPDDAQAEEKFQNCQQAYEVLLDDDKRYAYMRGGLEAVREAEVIAQHRRRRRRDMRKGPSERRPLHVTLEELYCGATKTLTHVRKRVCEACHGDGRSEEPRKIPEPVEGEEDAEAVDGSSSPSNSSSECSGCDGHGKVMALMQGPIPGFFSRQIVECEDCHGTGKKIEEKYRCESCEGSGMLHLPIDLEAFVDKGMEEGDKIVFEGEADMVKGHEEPGDLVFVLAPEPHQEFRRDHNHLFIMKTINLSEALTGVRFLVNHLDGRKLIIKSRRGEVIQPGAIRMIEGEGMPKKGRPFDKGNLYVKFTVEFPKRIPDEIQDRLMAMLPEKTTVGMVEGEEEITEEMELQEAVRQDEPQSPVHVDATQEDDEDSMPGRGCPLQ